MRLSRRSFIELLGTSTAYAFTFGCSDGTEPIDETPVPVKKRKLTDHAVRYFVDYTEWLFIHKDGSVTAHTGRVEMGQGLTTVLSNLISQGLQLPPDRVNLVLGDTSRCPDDGPTEGSSATRIVGWGYWRACERIRDHLVERAAEVLGVSAGDLVYRAGAVVGRNDADLRLDIGELADGTVHLSTIDPTDRWDSKTTYIDRKTLNVNGEAIVTGTLEYTGDLFPGEIPYTAWLLPEYHLQLTKLESADLDGAMRVPGISMAKRKWSTAMAVGDSYRAVERGLAAMKPMWKTPERSESLEVEAEIRAGARLHKMIEEAGDPDAKLPDCDVRLADSYITQYGSQVPIETETAVAEVDGDRATVWASMQAPFKASKRVADRLEIPEENVRIISMPVGGGFGVKVDTPAPHQAAELARMAGRKVRLVYSRAHQFAGRARYKEAVVADIASGVRKDGRLVARTIDLYQDEGFGATDTYDIPHVRTRLFRSSVPARHGTMRGTSFVQTCFAVESHTDMLAEAAGLDPLEFRRRNVAMDAFHPLLDTCAEMVDYGNREVPPRHGLGFAICHHGGRQLGVVAAEVEVDPKSGEVRVVRLDAAFDIGQIININTLTANTRGAMLWGLGFALFEEVRLDGHRPHTLSLSDYRIPRFSDVPPMEIVYLNNVNKRLRPRGCGELPVIPTVGAIANAVTNAIGVRFYTLPLTPQRVLAGLNGV
jgi:isoquinoline 1-oxidoreductase